MSRLIRWLRERLERAFVDDLTKLAIKHGTDKWGPHFYTPIYHRLFSHFRSRPIRVLEIGVGGYSFSSLGGASLLMWAEYFDKAKIFGIDCFEKNLQLGPRVTLLRGSQDDPEFLAKISRDHGPFEIVIDDGSHHPAHVVASFHGLFASVSDGGFYVIEDAQAAYWPSFGGSVDGSHTIALVRSVFELLNHSEIPIENPDFAAPLFAKTIRSFQAYHNLLIFEKGDNSAPSNKRYDPSNRHAASAISSMKHELSHSPTAEGLANLARLYLIRNEPSEAINAINHGLTIAPCNVTLLLAASDVAAATGNCHDRLAFAERASQQSPYDGALQLHLELIRSDLANQKEL